MAKDYYLVHHGIKGQKWGERRFQYEDGSYTPEGRIRYGIGDPRTEKSNKKYSKDAKRYYNEGTALIAAQMIGGVALASWGAYSIYKNNGFDYMNSHEDLMNIALGTLLVGSAATNIVSRQADKKLYKDSEFRSVNEIPKSTTNYNKQYFDSKSDGNKASEKLRKDVNPGYPNPGSNMNCMLCTTAMIMRLKGYDVRANKVKRGFEAFKPEDWFSNCEVKRVGSNNVKDLEDSLKKQGNGSYGNLMVSWKQGGGHSILYTVKNGKVYYIDGQTNDTYTAEKLFKYVNLKNSSYVELTDATPNDIVAGLVVSNKDRR